MRYTEGSVLNMTPAPPGWRVVVRHECGKEEPDFLVVQALVGWVTVVTYVDSDGGEMETDVKPAYITEGCSLTNSHEAVRFIEGTVVQVLEPGEDPWEESAQTWAQRAAAEKAPEKRVIVAVARPVKDETKKWLDEQAKDETEKETQS